MVSACYILSLPEMLMFPNNDGFLFYFSSRAASKAMKRLTNT